MTRRLKIFDRPDASGNPLRAFGAVKIAAGSRCGDEKYPYDHPAKNQDHLKCGLQHSRLVLRGMEGMIQVGQNIFYIFDSYTHSDESVADT